jgi:hypothetical protein
MNRGVFLTNPHPQFKHMNRRWGRLTSGQSGGPAEFGWHAADLTDSGERNVDSLFSLVCAR